MGVHTRILHHIHMAAGRGWGWSLILAHTGTDHVSVGMSIRSDGRHRGTTGGVLRGGRGVAVGGGVEPVAAAQQHDMLQDGRHLPLCLRAEVRKRTYTVVLQVGVRPPPTAKPPPTAGVGGLAETTCPPPDENGADKVPARSLATESKIDMLVTPVPHRRDCNASGPLCTPCCSR